MQRIFTLVPFKNSISRHRRAEQSYMAAMGRSEEALQVP
jgi:hypothetical protein